MNIVNWIFFGFFLRGTPLAEEYEDSNQNGKYDKESKYIDVGNGKWDEAEIFADQNNSKINLILETKIDYPKKIISDQDFEQNGFKKNIIKTDLGITEIYNHEKKNDKFDFLFLCYGGMLEETLKAATKLFIEEELTSKILLPNQMHGDYFQTANLYLKRANILNVFHFLVLMSCLLTR